MHFGNTWDNAVLLIFLSGEMCMIKVKFLFLASVEMSISGLHYIKDHLEEETLNQTPVDGSSDSEEEDFFASM